MFAVVSIAYWILQMDCISKRIGCAAEKGSASFHYFTPCHTVAKMNCYYFRILWDCVLLLIFFLLSNDYRLVFWRNAWIQWLFSFKNIYWFQYFVRVAYKLLWPLAFWTLCWCKCASNWPKRAKINEYFAKMWNFGMTMAQAARQKGRIGSVGTAC